MPSPFAHRLKPNPANALGSTPRGAPTQTVAGVASEPLNRGAVVHLWNAGGVTRVRNANAADATRPGRGYVKAAAAAGGQVTVFLPGGVNDALVGLAPGDYFLGLTPGSVSKARVSKTGQLDQYIGSATPGGNLTFAPTLGTPI